ncbi:MAG: hypothetical protein ACKODP_02480 [Actinomycetota bacterium]
MTAVLKSPFIAAVWHAVIESRGSEFPVLPVGAALVAGLVAAFATDTSREKVVIGSLTAPPGRYQVHITAELKSGKKLTWHGNWITVK